MKSTARSTVSRYLAALMCVGGAFGCSTTPEVTPEVAAAQELETLVQSGAFDEVYRRANTEFDESDYLTAFQLYQAALDRDPTHVGAMINSGLCARRLGDVDGALAWYDKALEVAPADTTALQNRIIAGLLLGRTEETLPMAIRLSDELPDNPASWQQLGDLYMQLLRFNDAAAAFGHAAGLDDSNAQYHYSLGLAQAATDRYDDAAHSFERALSLDPSMREAYSPYVQMLMFSERYDEAWETVAVGQNRGARFDADLVLELQQRSGRVGPG